MAMKLEIMYVKTYQESRIPSEFDKVGRRILRKILCAVKHIRSLKKRKKEEVQKNKGDILDRFSQRESHIF